MNEDINIRLLNKNDAGDYFQLIDNNRERLKRYFPVTVSEIPDLLSCTVYVEQKIKQAATKELYLYVILKKGKMIGVLILKNIDWRIPKGELAYFIDKEYEGQGVMSVAMRWLQDYCFNELGMNKLFIKLSPQNKASQRLAIRSGFQLEGVLRQEFRIETGEVQDVEYYGKLK
ncbi:MAG: GNAT family protein [Saprospiraceae bacterium]